MPPKSSHQSSAELVDTWGRSNRTLTDRQCPHCGSVFHPHRSSSRYCSRACMWANNGGKNRKEGASWWTNAKGYTEGRIWLADGRQARVKQHRYIMEGMLGRPLHAWEDVHHKDGNKANNHPDNLEIMPHGDHSRLTNSMRDYSRGYSLNLTEEQRDARSRRAIEMRLAERGRAAIAKATGQP